MVVGCVVKDDQQPLLNDISQAFHAWIATQCRAQPNLNSAPSRASNLSPRVFLEQSTADHKREQATSQKLDA